MSNDIEVNWKCTCNGQIPQKANPTRMKPGGNRTSEETHDE